MKALFKTILLTTLFGLCVCTNSAYGQDDVTVQLTPITPHGGDFNNGGNRTPEAYLTSLMVSYSQTNEQIVFENLETSPLSFTYYLFDEGEALLQQGNIGLTVNGNYILNISNLTTNPYIIWIVIDGITYEGYLDPDAN